MPLEATQHTQDGAVAFAKFFIQTIDWGYATVSPAYMDHYFSASCVTCRRFRDAIIDARRLGHRYVGGRFTFRSSQLVPSVTVGTRTRIEVKVDVTGFEEVAGDGTFIRGQEPQRGLRFAVDAVWGGRHWSATGVGATS